MFLLLIWCICKYRFDGQDKIFIYSLLMFLIAYMILMIGSLLFLITYNTISAIHLESFIQRYVFPFSYLVIWLIELMLLFEMQLMKVRIETNEPVSYCQKVKFWKMIRFLTIFVKVLMSLLHIYFNYSIKN